MAHFFEVIGRSEKEKQKEKIEIFDLLGRIFIVLGLIQIVLILIGLSLPNVMTEEFPYFYSRRIYFYFIFGTIVSFIIAFVIFRFRRKPVQKYQK